MKKILFALVIAMSLSLSSCGTGMPTESEVSNKDDYESMFVLLEKNEQTGYLIVYHRETRVMYAISRGNYNCGIFTVMLNPDGTPMVYEKDKN